jgi:PPP family 3-phenylpropionic acid transporter
MKNQPAYLKTLYFLFFIGFGFASPYAGIFYKHILVAADGTPAIGMIGIIFFVMPLVSLIANIPAGILADKFQSGKHFITLFCFGVALPAALIGLAGEAFARDWTLGGKFLFIFVMLLFLNACFYPINPMLDAETLLYLNRHSRRELYGAYRLWGTYGWSVSTILMGALLFRFGHDSLIFYGTAAAFTVMGAVSWAGIEARPAELPILLPWHHLRKDALFQGFLIFIFLTGVVASASFIYVGYFFDDVMKTPLEIGWILGTWTLFEIPVLLFSRRLIALLGNRWLIVTGLLLNGIRLILFSFFTRETPYVWKWAASLLQGPGFALMHLGIIDFVDRQAHPEMRATYLSIMNVARMSLASALGGLMGSWMIRQWGSETLMLFCGLGSLALIFVFIGLLRMQGPTVAARDPAAEPP